MLNQGHVTSTGVLNMKHTIQSHMVFLVHAIALIGLMTAGGFYSPGIASADLQIVKTVDDVTPDAGQTVSYFVTVMNAGPDGASGIEVEDILPSGVTYLAHSSSSGLYSPVTGLWSLPPLAASASATLEIMVLVDSGGSSTIVNTAMIVAGDESDPDLSNNSATATVVVGGADLQVSKSVSNLAPISGASVDYFVTLQNLGPNTATGVQVTDQLPAGVSYVTNSATIGTSYDNVTGEWDIGTLDAGSSVSLDISVIVTAASGASVTNTASVSGVDQADPNPDNNSDSTTFVVQELVSVETSTWSGIKGLFR
jgi:uncharacterized repeat protein (TIGR01451 family)